MDLMTTQVESLKNSENAQRLDGLMEDVHCALMNYQVCTSKGLTLAVSNICLRPHYNKTSESCQLIVSLTPLWFGFCVVIYE